MTRLIERFSLTVMTTPPPPRLTFTLENRPVA